MGNFNLNSGEIQNYNVEIIPEGDGSFKAIYVDINTDYGNHKFRITKDDRHPDTDAIANKLEKGLKEAQQEAKAFNINEYPERHYLFVSYPNGEQAQYTGKKLESK